MESTEKVRMQVQHCRIRDKRLSERLIQACTCKKRHTSTQAVRSHIQSVDPEIPEQSLRGCVRLGKYSDTKCHPILAKLSRSHDVSLILATRGKLASNPGMSVKPDMTPQEGATEINFVARM